MRMLAEVNGRLLEPEASAVIIREAGMRLARRQEQARITRQTVRLADAPDRASVAKAMLAVEDRLVRAFWTIARLPGERIGGNGRCGLDYAHEPSDLKGYTDAAGGNWESIAPRPPLPSAKDIDDAKAAIEWLLLIPSEGLRRILVVGATSKRGDVGRGIPWPRLRHSVGSYTERHLRNKYREALRTIVTELTLARLAR